MRQSETILKLTIEDIVFENRNKAYGAYQLRKDTDKFLKTGLLIGLLLVTILSVYSLTTKRASVTTRLPEITDTTVFIVKDVVLPKLPPVMHTFAQQPVLTAQTKLITFVPVPDNTPNISDDLPQVQNLPDVPIGTSNITGPVGPANIDADPTILTGGTGGVNDKGYVLVAGVMPEYVGGIKAMMAFLAAEIDYPRLAKENGIEGKVFVSFIINIDGSISDVEIVRGLGFGCDEETIRAIKAMPNWIPGKQNDVPVRVKHTIPVLFKLEKN